MQKAQHRLAVLLAPQGQVASWCLLRSAPSPRDRRCWRIGLQSGVEQVIEPVFEGNHDFGGDRPILLLVVYEAERVSQFSRPHLTVMLGQTAQFAQQMSSTQRMIRGQLEIHAPGVVHQEAFELRQHLHGLQHGEAPLGMMAIQGELRAAHPMHPLQLAVHLAARPLLGVRSGQDAASLVSVQDGLLKEGSFELCFEVHKPVRGQLEVQDDGAVTGTRPTQHSRPSVFPPAQLNSSQEGFRRP